MTVINIEEIRRDVEGYLRHVEAGETLVIVRSGQPVAEIRPLTTNARPLRPYGLCAGEFSVPEEFDEAFPEEVLRQFEGA